MEEGRRTHPGHMDTAALTCVVRERGATIGKGPEVLEEPEGIDNHKNLRNARISCEDTKEKGHRQWGWTGGGPILVHPTHSKTPLWDSNLPESITMLSFPEKLARTRNSSLDHLRVTTTGVYKKYKEGRAIRDCKRFRGQTGWCMSSLLTVFLLVLGTLTAPVMGQTDACPSDTDCHPPSENLLNPVYPARTLEVSSTCGTPAGTNTIYRKTAATLDFADYVCNASDPHPKEYMYDYQNEKVLDFQYENPKLNTYWQSMNTIPVLGRFPTTQYVVFNMTESFLVRYIRIVFISPHILSPTDNADNRPLAMALERKEVPGGEWEPWRYYAKDCRLTFSEAPWQSLDGTGPDYDAVTPVCQQRYYAGSTPVTGWGFGRQEVQFNPSQDYDPEFQTSAVVQRHFMASAVRLRLVLPADTEPYSSYYAIGDLEVDGQCSCFGHASFCSGVNGATCGCQHNTEGENCERCLPLYNNKPWRPGALQKSNACEDCECGGHATSCHYDADKGHGVCDNCTDNTMGDKCHYCIDHFYINPANTSLISPTATCIGSIPGHNGTEYIEYVCSDNCIPCNCSLEGSDAAGGFSCQNATGQCVCKMHVEGRDCSVCVDQFYNLTSSNPHGCQACSCELSGTFNNTQLCDKHTGSCVCKNNTQGYRCDECKAGFYDLQADNPDGCTPCDCDPGASTNTTCPLITGVCPCRSHIGGRTCRVPATGFYVPALDHMTYDAEFAPNVTDHFSVTERPGHGEIQATVTGRGFVQLPESSTLRLSVRVPTTTTYHVVARYETAAVWAPAHLSLMASDPGNVSDYSCGGATIAASSLLQLDTTLQPASLTGGADFGQLCLLGNVDYDFHFELGNSDPRGESLLLDSVVLLPALEELPFFGEVTPETRASLQACYLQTVAVHPEQRANMSCSELDYSVMAYIYDGAIGCECDPMGSNSSLCDPIGGQCPCKPGVMLLDCSQCQVDYYGFSTGEGCTPCGCDAHGSVRTACNDTGTCECRPNVHGVRCDTCRDDHYGLYTGKGCVPCTCNLDYAYNNSCQDSGQCDCKPGVGGQNCDFCMDGYFNLTVDGCTPCSCDPDGSTSLMCDKTTGNCECKTLALGDKCDTCQPGYFALGDWSSLGCLQCYCSGHSSDCNSAPGWFLTNASNDWSLLMSATAIQEPWLGVDDAGNSVKVGHPVRIIGNEGQFVMQIVNQGDVLPLDGVFFVASASYLGNKRSAYKHNLSFSLSMYIAANNDTDPMMTPDSIGDVILEGHDVDFRLVAALPAPPIVNVTEYSFPMSSEAWHVDTVSGLNPTYVQMIQILSDLSAIKIRAKYSNVSGGEVALYSALLTYATNDSSSGLPVNNVENCTCPRQYTGQQCEDCAAGYTRLTPEGGAYTECVPCNCHGHGLPGMPCDPVTGRCVCDHNTMGNLCQLCEEGYYGDPTRGAPDACKPCMCPGNVIEGDVNVFAHSCELGPQSTPVCHNCTEGHGGDQCNVCVNHWYGVPTDPKTFDGRCVPCVCHGRADTCNTTTGVCTDCVNNTAGMQCDICAPTFYGNALSNDCKPCECTELGAVGDCNPRTGQCVCKPNVVGFRCNECGPNSFNYSSGLGCQDCDCHPVGALDQQCNPITGQCVCIVHVEGRSCDRCEDTFWNINARTGCDPCDCSELGTANVTGQPYGTCDVKSGQCTCAREAIIGRTCDYCARGTKEDYVYVKGIYVGTYPHCELCGECFDNWAVKIDEVGVGMLEQYTEALHIWDHYGNMTVEEVNPIIGNLSVNISRVDDTINDTYRTVRELRDLQLGFDAVGTDIIFHTEEETQLEASLADARTALATLESFTGALSLPTPTPTTTTVSVTSQHVADVTMTQQMTYAAANASWMVIQNLTEAVRVSNGSVTVFIDRVGAAMLVIDDARRMSDAARMVLGGQLYLEDGNNTARLARQEEHIRKYSSIISTSTAHVEAGVLLLREGNMTIDQAAEAVQVRLAEMTGYLDTAQVTGYNATMAKVAADQAAGVVSLLLNEATRTLGNLTEALVTVASGLHLVENITMDIVAVDVAVEHVAAMTPRPLADLQAVTSQIEATSVSSAEVQELLNRADVTLNMASTAINVTETASEEAHKTLDLITTIQYNLEEASIQRNKTHDLMNTVTNYNYTITSTLDKVQTKSSLAATLADEIHANITIAAADINDIYRCFQDKQQRSNTTRQEAQAAQTTSRDSAALLESNVAQLREVTARTDGLEGRYTAFLQGLLDVKGDVDVLLSDLGFVSGSTDIGFLLETFQSQKSAMDDLYSEIQNINAEVNLAHANLDRLDPNTATCTHN